MPDNPINILMVDDRPENLLALECMLLGLDPDLVLHSATCGEEALEAAALRDYALVLLDVQMPDMDGFEVCRALQEAERTRGIPVIFVTAISRELRYVHEGYSTGAVDYLFKPLDKHIVRSKVKTFVELYRQRDEIERAHRELQQAQDHLVRSSRLESIGRLASSVAQEVRDPLETQRLGVEHLKRNVLEISDRECLKRLHQMGEAIARAETIIEGLVEYASLQEVNPEGIDVNGALSRVLDLIRPELKHSNITVDVDLAEDLPHCNADRQKIMQVFLNLIANARFAMPEGGRLQVSSRSVAPDGRAGRAVRVELQDSGGGVDGDNLEKVFEPFFTTRPDEGSGLGLTICADIVEIHRGNIRLENRGEGACATVELPV